MIKISNLNLLILICPKLLLNFRYFLYGPFPPPKDMVGFDKKLITPLFFPKIKEFAVPLYYIKSAITIRIIYKFDQLYLYIFLVKLRKFS